MFLKSAQYTRPIQLIPSLNHFAGYISYKRCSSWLFIRLIVYCVADSFYHLTSQQSTFRMDRERADMGAWSYTWTFFSATKPDWQPT